MKGVVILMLAVVMVQFMVRRGEALDCNQLQTSLTPCLPYVTAGGDPSAPCCDGVKNLKASTPTTADRRAACDCLKGAVSSIPNINVGAAAALPSKCGVEISTPISKDIDCSKIN